ncbi:MAG TPA: hypothetical protein VNT77_05660 [Allosphingosinicella sp.]|nr:hypothetical protein [Allosphingosinicella sp.]
MTGRRRLLVALFWGARFRPGDGAAPQGAAAAGITFDKIQHIIAFAALTALASAAYARTPLVKLGVGLSAFGALIELLQLIPPLHRDGSVADWIADTLAVAAVLAFTRLRRRGKGR